MVSAGAVWGHREGGLSRKAPAHHTAELWHVAMWCDFYGQKCAQALQAPGCEVFLPWVSVKGCLLGCP